MATRYNPRLIVRMGGLVIATADDPAAPPPFLAIDKLSVPWGRDRVWEHQQPGQATFSIIDRAFYYGPHNGPALQGQAVTFSYDIPGVLAERIFFRGTVSADIKATVLPPGRNGENRGLRLDLTALSVPTSLASVTTGEQVYAAETFIFRYSRLRNLIWPSLVSSAPYDTTAADVFGNTLNWSNRNLAARTYSNERVLSALQELLDHTGDRQTYDPHTNALGFARRKVIDDPAGYAVLTAGDPGELVLKVPGHLGVPMLDGGEFTGGQLVRSIETNLTALHASRWTDSTGATEADGTTVYVDQAADALAPNRMNIRTDWYSGTDSAQTLAIWSGMIGNEAKRWIPDPLTHQTQRVGGLTLDQVPLLLNGAEPAGYVYLSRTDWARAQIAPVWSIIGGTVAYQGGDPGWWQPTVQLASVYFRNAAAGLANARTPANCDPAAVHPIKAADLSPALSAADARFWTAAYTG
jgi:hypothetical protein